MKRAHSYNPSPLPSANQSINHEETKELSLPLSTEHLSPTKSSSDRSLFDSAIVLPQPPVIHKDLKYSDWKIRFKRYRDAVNVKSDYFLQNKAVFRSRSFIREKVFLSSIVQDQLFLYLDHECETCNKFLRTKEIIEWQKADSHGFYCAKWYGDIFPSITAITGIDNTGLW